jgi:hypothetical protein
MITHGGLRNPIVREMVRNGLASPSSGASNYSEEKKIQTRYLSGFESLVYYFNEEWFDLKNDMGELIQKGRDFKKRNKNQPKRCGECSEPWSTDPDGVYYIDRVLFKRLPMVLETCPECL